MVIDETNIKYDVEKLEGSRVKVNVEVDQSEREKSLEKAYKSLVKRVQVPGFRKGYTPRTILERYLGNETFESEAIKIVARETLEWFLNKENIILLQDPYFDIPNSWKENENLKFSFVLEVPPEFKLGNYKGLNVKKEKVEVTEEEIDRVIEQVELQLSKLNPVEEGQVEKGDVVYLERIKEDGTQLPPMWFTLNGKVFPELEEKILGMKPGEEKEFEITFPEDFYEKDLVGQTLKLKWKVNKIWRYEKPDQETFLQKVGAQSLEEFREKVRESIKEERERRSEDKAFSEIVSKILESTELDPPLSYVQYLAENIFREFINDLAKRGISLDDYLNEKGITKDEFIKNVIEDARNRIRMEMILEKIAEVENISVSDQEVEDAIREIADSEGRDYEEVKKEIEKENLVDTLKRNLIRDKVKKFLLEQNLAKEE
jgi:trigger factor